MYQASPGSRLCLRLFALELPLTLLSQFINEIYPFGNEAPNPRLKLARGSFRRHELDLIVIEADQQMPTGARSRGIHDVLR